MPAVLATFLIGMVGSIVGRVLVSLGFTVVTVIGVEASIGTMRNFLISSVASLPADVFNLFLLAGGGVALNVILGAISFRLSYWAITKATRIIGVGA